MWKRENFVTHEIETWYSTEEFNELEKELAKYKEMLYNIHKAFDTCTPINDIEDFIEDEKVLEEFEERRDRELKEWTEKSLNVKSVEQSTVEL